MKVERDLDLQGFLSWSLLELYWRGGKYESGTSVWVREGADGEMIGVCQGKLLLLSRWSPSPIHWGRPVFTRPQPKMSRQLYGSREYMRTMLEAMWSFLQACALLSSCCLTAHRDALSQQEQEHYTHTHMHTLRGRFCTTQLTVWHGKKT